MKKSLIVLISILVLITGCEKKEEKNLNNNQNEQNVVNNNESSSNKETNNTKENDETNNDTTPSKDNVDSSNANITLGENEYISLSDNKVHKYTFTYPDEATCICLGDGEPYNIVYPVKPYVVFGCEKVKDANGNILWDEVFYAQADLDSIFYY